MTIKHRFENPLDIAITLRQDAVTARLLRRIITQLERNREQMATVAEAIEAVKTAASEEREEVRTALDGLKTEIQALKDQIANGSQVTEEQMQELLTTVEDIHVADEPTP